jgi:hypothetical protein
MTVWLVEGQATGLASGQARNEVFSPFGQRGLTLHTFYSDTGNPQPHPKLLVTPFYNFASSSRDRLPLKATRGLDRALLFGWVRVKETDRVLQAEIKGKRALEGLATLVYDNCCRQGGFSPVSETCLKSLSLSMLQPTPVSTTSTSASNAIINSEPGPLAR